MKKWLNIMAAAFFLCMAFVLLKPNAAYAKDHLDEILEYTIYVTPDFEDGSLDMDYKIRWRVLDDKTEGPLEWVKIGIPNESVENIKALSDNIASIRYFHSGGEYIRVNFKNKYYAGEEVEFEFSFRQHRMYQTDVDANQRIYSFTPGWFNDIDVDCISIFWADTQVKRADDNLRKKDGYYIYTGFMDARDKVTVRLIYDRDIFAAEDWVEISHKPDPKIPVLLFLIVMPFCFLGIRTIVYRKKGYKDAYTSQRGMGTYYYSNHIHTHHYGGGGGCACACACACAGGGRAGCSKKDFYGTKLELRRIRSRVADVD